MEDEQKPHLAEAVQEEVLQFRDKHRYMILIAATIVIAIVLVSISLVIYNVSGSAQLDLSRPGYQAVSDQVDEIDDIQDYSAFGPVNKDAVDEFRALYNEEATKAKAVDAFNGDPLNPEVLEFGTPSRQ